MATVKGYKAFREDLTCRDMQYEIGKTYTMEGEPILCERGYHFCENLSDVYMFYPMNEKIRVCEVEALGLVVTNEDGTKSCTNKIKIVREIENPKKKTNSKQGNSGWFNSGIHNTGSYNSGCFNSGDCNTGNYNSGSCNAGFYNKGIYNTGDDNSGGYNSGNGNMGNWNTGDYNHGYKNTGDFNTGNYNSGCFNTEPNPTIKMFNKESNWTMHDWNHSDARYILENIPVHKTNEVSEEGHLKYEIINVTDEERQIWWDKLSLKKKRTVLALPNFDADIFYRCTGIKVKINKKRKETKC